MSRTMIGLEDHRILREIGKMFREWADNPAAQPDTPEGVKKALESKGATFAANVKGVKLHNYEKDFMHISLPNTEHIEATFDSFKTAAGRDGYALGEPYITIGKKLDSNAPVSEAELTAFYLFRLADYVLQHCE